MGKPRFSQQRFIRNLAIACTLIVLGVFALVSVKQGWHNAVLRSQDFMWSPTVLLAEHRNPYQIFLEGNTNGEIVITQKPIYLHWMYILLLPFVKLNWHTAKMVWGLLNIGIAIANSLLVCKIFCLNTKQSLLLVLLFLASTPFRNGIGNGQQQEVVLLLFLLGLSLESPIFAALFAGISYVKYSFAPAIAQALYLRRGINYLLLSLVVPLVGAVVFAAIVLQNPVEVLLQPFAVTDTASAPGLGDLMTIVRKATLDYPAPFRKAASYLIPFAGSLLGGILIHRRSINLPEFIAYTATNSLIFFRHVSYDYIFLLPMVAVVMTSTSLLKRIIIGLGVTYYWYVMRILHGIDGTGIDLDSLLYVNFLINFLMLLTVTLETKRLPLTAAQATVGNR